jgi:hypothetical protein
MTGFKRHNERPAPVRMAGSVAADAVTIWEHLAGPTQTPARFDPSLVAEFPEPARRWLTHAIPPGAALARGVILKMEGQIRVRRWLPFEATQILVPPEGYVWAARARFGPLSIRGYDRYSGGIGAMRWRLAGKIPVVTMDGPDVDRSAAGRLAAEAVWVPTALLGPDVRLRAGHDSDTTTAEWSIGPHTLRTDIHVDPAGAPRSVNMMRWGNPLGEPFGEYPFGADLDDEATFDGITIPTRICVGYFHGTQRWSEGEFFRAQITEARFI